MGIAEITFSVSVADEWITRTVDLEVDEEILEDYRTSTMDFIIDDPMKDMESIIMDLAFDEIPENYTFEHYDDIVIIECPAEISYDPREDERHPRNLDW